MINARYLFLIGFMGAGKSTIGEQLAAEITSVQPEEARNLPRLIEMDEQIEAEQGMPISKIFSEYGEEYFRDLETAFLQNLRDNITPAIVSCGGGVVLREQNVRLMKACGRIILLTAKPGTILERVKDSTQRPILNGHMEENYIRELMEKRLPFYESAADITVATDGRTPSEICAEIRKKVLALDVIELLKKEYPLAECTLDYRDAWQLLVSVRLAAQCTDARVDIVTPKLYEKFPTVAALAAADPAEIEEIVKPCGLGHSKARDISGCMRILHEKYDDRVPDTMQELLALPGVGRKSANLILGDVYGKPAIVTDTHCIRLTNLIGLVDGIKEPGKVERELWKIIPPEEGNDLCHRFVHHGRAVCVARRPNCGECCLRGVCRHAQEQAQSPEEEPMHH